MTCDGVSIGLLKECHYDSAMSSVKVWSQINFSHTI